MTYQHDFTLPVEILEQNASKKIGLLCMLDWLPYPTVMALLNIS